MALPLLDRGDATDQHGFSRHINLLQHDEPAGIALCITADEVAMRGIGQSCEMLLSAPASNGILVARLPLASHDGFDIGWNRVGDRQAG